ncbi:ATP-binding protein [Streptomyces sp. NPDC088757]|uniref:ATP-binding protein n=1 Tax=Streptomyces sp. NPDC088757 TaxID=3365889 RepID=UPI00382DAFB3
MNQKNTTQSPSSTRDFGLLLSSTPRGARLARLLAVEWLREYELPYGTTESAAQVVAELAANAVTHGRVAGRDFRLALRLSPEVLRIEVTDTRGDGLPRPQQPCQDAESGRGLLLVEVLADRWGVAPGPVPQKAVWVELDLSPRPEHGNTWSGGSGCLPKERGERKNPHQTPPLPAPWGTHSQE